jgi:hypothetical protein
MARLTTKAPTCLPVAWQQTVSLAGATEEARLAFGLNLYNTMLLHGLIERGAPEQGGQGLRSGGMAGRSWLANVRYKVAGEVLTLADLEQALLRGGTWVCWGRGHGQELCKPQ